MRDSDPRTVRRRVTARLRSRLPEIESAIMAKVVAVSEPVRDDPIYIAGLREAVAAAVERGLEALELGSSTPPRVPLALIAQARLAARSRTKQVTWHAPPWVNLIDRIATRTPSRQARRRYRLMAMEETGRAAAEVTGPEGLGPLAKAMSHPVQSKILFVIADRPGVTIRQIASRLEEPERKVRHHLEALVEAGLVSVESEVRTRNTTVRRYAVERRPHILAEDTERLSEASQRRLSLEVLKLVLADARAAVAAGAFGTHEGHTEVRFWAEVDREGWEEMVAIHQRAIDEMQAALASCAERLADDDDRAAFPVTSALLLFEAPGWVE
jgi:DNA-binding transcriptional ArsR family regulator